MADGAIATACSSARAHPPVSLRQAASRREPPDYRRTLRDSRLRPRPRAPAVESRTTSEGPSLIDLAVQIAARQHAAGERPAQRIADDDGGPAQRGRCEIERFGEVESGEVCREQNIGTHGAQQEGFADLSGHTGDAVTNQIANERIRRPGEKCRGITRTGGHPVFRRRRNVRASEPARFAAIEPGTKVSPRGAAAIFGIGAPQE